MPTMQILSSLSGAEKKNKLVQRENSQQNFQMNDVEKFFRQTKLQNQGITDGKTDGQTDVEFEIVVKVKHLKSIRKCSYLIKNFCIICI